MREEQEDGLRGKQIHVNYFEHCASKELKWTEFDFYKLCDPRFTLRRGTNLFSMIYLSLLA